MAKTSKQGRTPETGPFVTGQEETLHPHKEVKPDKRIGRIKRKK